MRGRGLCSFLERKESKELPVGVGVGFDITRSNIPFGSLDICVPNKIDDGTTAKAAHPSALLFARLKLTRRLPAEGAVA